ncbi:hypothetical protein VTO42DRAFT_2038 [Malbranchea cinnamomea]
MAGLTPEQLSVFYTNGFLVIPNFLSASEVSSLLSTAHDLLNSFDIASHPLTRFTTGDSQDANNAKHVGDDYFLSSGDKIHFFFEPDAFTTPDPASEPSAKPTLKRDKARSINKIGHALHALSPPFTAVTLSERNRAIARSLGFKDPRVLQSMLICKQPSFGAAVPPHLDSEFLYTDPPSAVGWWIALEDANKDNGTLGFWRGSHKTRRVTRRFVRKENGEGTEFVEWNGAGLPRGMETNEKEDLYQPRDEDFELVDVPAGSLVLIHGNVLHTSERNTGDKSRFAYTFHVIEGADGWSYDEKNWLQPPKGGEFTKLYGDGK